MAAARWSQPVTRLPRDGSPHDTVALIDFSQPAHTSRSVDRPVYIVFVMFCSWRVFELVV